MAITEATAPEDLCARAGVIARATRRVRVVAWILALGWSALLVALLVVGERQSSYAHLTESLRAGDVGEVEVVGALPADARGWASVDVRWRDGILQRRTTFTNASNDGQARQARRQGSADPVVVGSVADHLTALDPDLRVTSLEWRSTRGAIGWSGPDWIAPVHLVLLVSTLMLIAGPRPWRATRWAWAWLVLLVPVVGVPAYFVLGGPLGLLRPRDPRRTRLTGGWAFLLALVLGGGAAAG